MARLAQPNNERNNSFFLMVIPPPIEWWRERTKTAGPDVMDLPEKDAERAIFRLDFHPKGSMHTAASGGLFTEAARSAIPGLWRCKR